MTAQWPLLRPLRARGGQLAFRQFELDDGNTTVGLFQGSFGRRPDLDSIVRYKQQGRAVRTPKHLHWAIDLLLKRQHAPGLTREFVTYLIEVYDQVKPYTSKDDRANRPIQSATSEVLEHYSALNQYGEYSVEFTLHIVEIMAAIEKTGNPDAFMFKKVLKLCAAPDSELDIYATISTAGFRGR